METKYQAPAYSAFKGPLIGRDKQPYIPDEGLMVAANLALALSRPLLLTGEPGCGKTEFAFAAMTSLNGDAKAVPEQYYVRSDTVARDLLYRYDAVRRFSDAQLHIDTDTKQRAASSRHYITLEALGKGLVSPTRTVVLIDEIDKAQRDLPNDLLRELDRGEFEIAEIPEGEEGPSARASDGPIKRSMRSDAKTRPLVVITSNVERQLPDAFLRRCIFYYLPFPESKLVNILKGRFTEGLADHFQDATDVFLHLRQQSLRKKPATAELIDWFESMSTVFEPSYVWPRLARQAQSVRERGAINWREIEGIAALIKLREDLLSLGIGTMSAVRG